MSIRAVRSLGQPLPNSSELTLPQEFRKEFSVFQNLHYLNSCSQGALANSVKESLTDYLETMELHGSSWNEWAGFQEKARTAVATFLAVPRHEVAITSSVSAAISSVASSLDFTGKRKKIVLTENDFPTSGQIWHAQELRGAEIVHAPANEDATVNMSELMKLIDNETLLVCISHICFRNGVMTELEPIIEAARRVGALVMIDAYQSIGSVPIYINALKPDFLVGGTLKYLLGTPGTAFLYASTDTTSHLIPTSTGWFAARDIFAMEIHSYDPASDARKFESGTPVVPSLYAAVAGLEIINSIGIGKIHAHVSTIHEAIRDGLDSLGANVVTPRDPHKHGAMLAIASLDQNQHVAALEDLKVITSSRDGNVRISPHFYNDESDVEAVVSAFAKTRHLLAK